MNRNKGQDYRKIEAVLYRYPEICAEIRGYKLKLAELENDFDCLHCMSVEERPSATNNIDRPVEREAVRRENSMFKIKLEVAKLEIEAAKVENLLSLLSDDEHRLIELVYFKRYTFKGASEKLDISEKYAVSLRKKTIENKLLPLAKCL